VSAGHTVEGSAPPVTRCGGEVRITACESSWVKPKKCPSSCTKVLRPVVPRKLPHTGVKPRSLAIITSAWSMSLEPTKQVPSCSTVRPLLPSMAVRSTSAISFSSSSWSTLQSAAGLTRKLVMTPAMRFHASTAFQ
jgi:hypothetical protein